MVLALALSGSCLVGVLPQNAHANLEEDVQGGEAAMRNRKWPEAKVFFDRAIANFGEKGPASFGPKFGLIYYMKGYNELQYAKQLLDLKNEEAAANAKELLNAAKESFTKCRELPSNDKGVNPQHNKCMLYLGQAQQHLGEYKEAIESYQTFLQGRKKQRNKDKYHAGMYQINMAICHFRLEEPALAVGSVYYENALNNKDKLFVPDAAIVSAFKDFAAGAIKLKEEKLLIDFINKNRGTITLDPYQMYQFIPFFRKYGAEAFSKNMVDAAYNLYALMPGTPEAFEDIAVVEKNLAGFNRPIVADGFINKNARQSVERVRKDLEYIQSSMQKGEPHELLALRSLAATHEQEGYIRGAYNAYKTMELYYKKSQGREDNLFNLVRTSSLVGEVMETEKFGRLFLKLFPESKHVPAVKNMMLISLFYSGEYEVSLKVATELIDDLPENSEQHDLCLHVLGGSMFYLAQFFDSYPHLKKHVEMYPESQYKVAARYFVASNYAKMENWQKAAEYLDKFLADFPDPAENVYIPLALYDRANTHFAEEELDEAITKLDRLEREFPGSPVESIAFILRGDIHRAKNEKNPANEYYLKGLELAKRQGEDIVAEEGLYKLVALHGQDKINKNPNPNIKDAIPYYDEFWRDRQKSVYKTQVAVSGVNALRAAGRGEEALLNLQGVLAEMAKKKNAPGLEEAINTYGKFYLQAGKTPEQLKDHFEDFEGIDAGDKRAQALLRIAVIGVYEDLKKGLEKSEDPADIEKLGLVNAKIEAMFKDMNAKFKKSELSDFILLRLANFIAENTGNPRMALPYYDEILQRGRVQFQVMAQFGRAGILAKSDDRSEQNQALETLKKVLANKDISRDDKEKATYSLIEIYEVQENWAGIIEQAVAYNEAKYSSGNTPFVGLKLAQAYERQGIHDKAKALYAGLVFKYKSRWEVSIPAIKKSAKYTINSGKGANGLSAKQVAYNLAARFIYGSTKAYEENKLKMPPEVRKSWEDLRDQVLSWESESGIKSVPQQRKEKAGN